MGIAWFFILFTLFCYITLNILWVKYYSDSVLPQEKEGDDAFFYSAMYLSQND